MIRIKGWLNKHVRLIEVTACVLLGVLAGELIVWGLDLALR